MIIAWILHGGPLRRSAQNANAEPADRVPPSFAILAVQPNRISSSDLARPDRFNLDQYAPPVHLERQGTAMNCNPNCNPNRLITCADAHTSSPAHPVCHRPTRRAAGRRRRCKPDFACTSAGRRSSASDANGHRRACTGGVGLLGSAWVEGGGMRGPPPQPQDAETSADGASQSRRPPPEANGRKGAMPLREDACASVRSGCQGQENDSGAMPKSTTLWRMTLYLVPLIGDCTGYQSCQVLHKPLTFIPVSIK
jgi:hypothetical protein